MGNRNRSEAQGTTPKRRVIISQSCRFYDVQNSFFEKWEMPLKPLALCVKKCYLKRSI